MGPAVTKSAPGCVAKQKEVWLLPDRLPSCRSVGVPKAGVEPIPTQWPNAMVESIPTWWPNDKLLPITAWPGSPVMLHAPAYGVSKECQ
jgi:hypothetical protein